MRRLAGAAAIGAVIVATAGLGNAVPARTDQAGGVAGTQRTQPSYPVRSQLESRLDMLPLGGSQLGISLRDLDAAAVKQWTLPASDGVLVDSVERGGPGDKGGMRAGDVIAEFGGERVRSVKQLRRLLGETPEGVAVKVVVLRGGQRLELSVTPGPVVPERASAYEDLLKRGFDGSLRSLPPIPPDRQGPRDRWPLADRSNDTTRLGIATQEMTPQLAEYFGAKEGVLVSSVTDGSPAAKAGIRAGDVVTAIDGAAVKTPDDLARAIRNLPDGHEVTLTVVHDRKPLAVTIQLAAGRPPL